MDKEKIDEISKLLPQMIDSGLVDSEDEAYEILKMDYPELHGLAAGIFDSIKSVGQHACGWVFGTKERPLSEWVPQLLIVSSNTQVSAYNLKAIEELGLVKGDFLRLKTLSAIKRNLQLIGKDALDLEAIPLDDEATFEMLREGRTEGVFTLQGKANRQGCVDIGVENVHDVIATTAIYRPALMRGELNKTYIRRRREHEDVEYPSEAAEAILSESYGLPIYQEQLMDLAYASV